MQELLKVEDLRVNFPLKSGFLATMLGQKPLSVQAVNGLGFQLERGEILALVGESGSGKTTVGKAVVKTLPPGVASGKIYFDGLLIEAMRKAELRHFRRNAQMVFQDPYQSLNPKNTVLQIVAEPLAVNGLVQEAGERRDRVRRALEQAGLRPAADYLARYPHELSGGQRQRVAIAAALILEPRLIVADEPVSMLDVSIRAGILQLLVNLRDELGISYLFITHDLSLAWAISDRIAIMYLGKLLEMGRAGDVIKKPQNPYSRSLLEVMPRLVPRMGKTRNILRGETPNPVFLPRGCVFHPRCPRAHDICREAEPLLAEVGEGHFAACHML